MQVSARVTVTPEKPRTARHARLFRRPRLSTASVFRHYSVPPKRPTRNAGAMISPNCSTQMVACGEEFERRTVAGERYPFANFAVRACRRFTKVLIAPTHAEQEPAILVFRQTATYRPATGSSVMQQGAMGRLADGIDRTLQADWLAERHVHRQEPCRSCWARYLCGGGCHHEVIHRGRPACDYIRGWLHYCFGAYGAAVLGPARFVSVPIEVAPLRRAMISTTHHRRRRRRPRRRCCRITPHATRSPRRGDRGDVIPALPIAAKP